MCIYQRRKWLPIPSMVLTSALLLSILSNIKIHLSMGFQHVYYILGCPCRQSDLTSEELALGDSSLSSWIPVWALSGKKKSISNFVSRLKVLCFNRRIFWRVLKSIDLDYLHVNLPESTVFYKRICLNKILLMRYPLSFRDEGKTSVFPANQFLLKFLSQ